MSDAMVTVAEVAAAMGRKPDDVEREARELGLLVRNDWAGRPALSTDEARALASGDARRGLEHMQAWEAHQRETRQWVAGRSAAIHAAAQKVRERGSRLGPGDTAGKARQAAHEAAEHYERRVPRPLFNGRASTSLEYIEQEVPA